MAAMEPLHFHPWLRPQAWGGRRLIDQLGKPAPTDGPYGESWEVSDHPLHRSVAAAGPWAGRTLRQLLEAQPEAVLGPGAGANPVFPWLIKLLDAHDRLSVQVHPDDEAAGRLRPGECGKTEAWLVLDAAPGGRVWAGLLPGVDEAALREALRRGTVADCLHSFEPRPGDCVFLPAGTVHAVGGGVVFAEVQQTSDVTFRLFDWDRRDAEGRPRPLHVEEALASIDWRQGPVKPVRIAGFGDGKGERRRVPLARCRYFHLDYIEETGPFGCGGDGRLRAVMVVRGSGRLVSAGGEEQLAAGQTWVLPAAMPPAECVPETCLGAVLCTLPPGR
jgi:mannose-6-phosphate isomerase